jgi:prepilin-type N-terminal cleavage/methylation domain-containing protein
LPISSRHAKSGFTLVEILVALSIGMLLLLGARITLDIIADSAERTARRAKDEDRLHNGERVARRLFLDTEPAGDSTPFVGSGTQLKSTSWCDTPAGGRSRCVVTVSVARSATGDSASFATLTTSAGDAIRLRSAPRIALRYLSSASNGGVWRQEWNGGLMLPLALGVVTDRDTTVFRIGERR